VAIARPIAARAPAKGALAPASARERKGPRLRSLSRPRRRLLLAPRSAAERGRARESEGERGTSQGSGDGGGGRARGRVAESEADRGGETRKCRRCCEDRGGQSWPWSLPEKVGVREEEKRGERTGAAQCANAAVTAATPCARRGGRDRGARASGGRFEGGRGRVPGEAALGPVPE
jgi:hypothetical protein